MYCTEFLDEDWNAEFLAEFGPLQSNKASLERFNSTDSDRGFEIEPGTLSDKIAKRKSTISFTRMKKSKAETMASRPSSRHRARSIELREKENRLAAMEAALHEERRRLKLERSELEAAKRKSSLSVDQFEEFKKSHQTMQSYMSELDKDDEMLRELGFVVDETINVQSSLDVSANSDTDSGSPILDMKFDAEDTNVLTLDILKTIHAMERELEENPFMSLTGGAEFDTLDDVVYSSEI